MSATVEDKRAALFRRTSTPVLIASMRKLYALPKPTADERRAAAWTADELERRHPAAAAELGRMFDALGDEPAPKNYAGMLLDALRAVGVTR